MTFCYPQGLKSLKIKKILRQRGIPASFTLYITPLVAASRREKEQFGPALYFLNTTGKRVMQISSNS